MLSLQRWQKLYPQVFYILSFVTMNPTPVTHLQKIKKLYNLPENDNAGFDESEIIALEKRLRVQLPAELRNYYLELGKNEPINYSHNRLLKPGKEIRFSKDRYLVFIRKTRPYHAGVLRRLTCYCATHPFGEIMGLQEKPDWYLETGGTDLSFC
ncbi:SMI1/KNR4 family protein [Niabella hibiscisoli]|uniref:SMI1/KNR4 family protein n=1 Tax=Niabella hibiscisoli TaxID=1825928 RepID=UPI001F0DB447|nr:SMI1/KNR4 family protein [Niabella hibiscisoli]MCH5720555.1 SMI1/KNR4 family protein [Niabella hibiscisoli]